MCFVGAETGAELISVTETQSDLSYQVMIKVETDSDEANEELGGALKHVFFSLFDGLFLCIHLL